MYAKFADKVFRVLFVLAFVLGTVWMPGTNAGAQEGMLTFAAHLPGNQIHAYNWTAGSTLVLIIDDPDISGSPDFEGSALVPDNDLYGDTWTVFELPSFELKPGQYLTITDGTTTKTHVIRTVAVTSVDSNKDIITGTAEPNTEVGINAHYESGGDYVHRNIVADADGNWTVNLSVPGTNPNEERTYDIVSGSLGTAFQWDDDGDDTFYEWRGYAPRMDIGVSNDFICAHDWPDGSTLTLTIDDASNGTGIDITRSQAVSQWQDNPSEFAACFDLMGQFDIQPEDEITITGGGFTRNHTARALTVTQASAATDTVTGTADPGAEVKVWLNAGNEWILRSEITDTEGNWAANYSVPGDAAEEEATFDLQPGTTGHARIEDEDGDATQDAWHVLNPAFTVWLNQNKIDGYGWPENAQVTLTVGDPASPEIRVTKTVGNANLGPQGIRFQFGDEFQLFNGQMITLSDGAYTRTHTITNLIVTAISADSDTMMGTADAGSEVEIYNKWDSGTWRNEITALDGSWTADFSVMGDEQGEAIADIRSGEEYHVCQSAQEGSTCWYLPLPNPSIGVRANDDYVEGWEWPLGAIVTIEIDDPATIEKPDTTDTATVRVADWDHKQTWFNFEFRGEYNIKTGDTVTATDGSTTKTHIVTNMAIDEINPTTNIVFGHTSPNSLVNVWACGNNFCVNREKTSDQFGNWQVNFSIPSDLDWEQDTIDIQPGTWVDSSQNDEDGDGTYFGRVAGSTLSGTAYLVEPIPENAMGGVMIEACSSSNFCRTTLTNESGNYWITGLLAGIYNIRAIPPGSNLPGSLGPIEISYDETLYGQDIIVSEPPLPPPPDAVEPAHTGGGTISVYWEDGLTLTAYGCTNGSASFKFIVLDEGYTINGAMAETPVGSGTYKATMPPLYPHHGAAEIVYMLVCPDGSTVEIPFFIYIDPSGIVKNTNGESIPGATVTLYYSENPDGLFTEVPDGSVLMSPSNRTNPDTTNANGQFGWDVVAGFYKVRVEKAGCYAPGDPLTTFFESAVLTIPPPVSDLELILECQPPQIISVAAPLDPVRIDQTITATATFNGPSSYNSYTVIWDWGDGSNTTLSADPPTASAYHNYASPGVYTVTVTITDLAGASDTASFQYIVIYDPNGGFVTGGGWITSPSGAYIPDVSLSGEANIGFVVKYKKEETVPSGNLDFQFMGADLNFKSTHYLWMVISKNVAQIKGEGAINNEGIYGFILTVKDGTPDTFRIKIWNVSTGAIVYDNMPGVSDGETPTTQLGGGSIVVHK